MNRTPPPAAPAFEDLPPRRSPSTGARRELSVSLAIVTPILGGGYRTRALDDIDIIRVPSVRGHLRFWWRALFSGDFEKSTSLYEAETKLWGGAGGGADKAPAVRSPVEVHIKVTDCGSEETGEIDPQKTAGAYALFPARSERRGGQMIRDTAPRRIAVAFNLTVTAPAEHTTAVHDAIQAWILFGGYGGRTRRGLGSLTVTGPNAAAWLPRAGSALTVELRRLFGRDVFAVGGSARQPPTLAGAALCTIGSGQASGDTAWLIAVDALRRFRQGSPDREPIPATATSLPSDWARRPGIAPEPWRPSISNWPEPDKIRHLAGRELETGPYSHTPRHNETPVWPRAGFGLPIVGRFQTKSRKGDSYIEPPPFKLRWRDRAGNDKHQRGERLMSPLIIKALPLVGGRCVAIALWLHRAWPAGEIVLEINGKVVPGSAAPFDALVAPGDVPWFTALAGKSTLRSAFFDWLAQRRDVTTVFPRRGAGGGAP